MVTLATLSLSGSHKDLSSAPLRAAAAMPSEERQNVGVPPLARTTSSARRRTKHEVAEAFLAHLRGRGGIDVDAPGFAEGLHKHFESLPSRCALTPPPVSPPASFAWLQAGPTPSCLRWGP